ncbi:MAG: MFS transporter [Euryarchaeota archaeon]|nr:MFS transporter [Euryarchaeota archaeon]
MRSDVIQFLSNSAVITSSIFIPLFARELGASNLEVGVIGASYGIAIFISSVLFGRASDLFGRRVFMQLGLGLCTLSFLLQVLAADVLSLTLIRFLAGFTLGIFTAPLIAYAFETGSSMGRFSSLGALGWALGNVVAGIIAVYSELFALSSLFFFIAFLSSLRMKEVPTVKVSLPIFPLAVLRRNSKVYFTYFLRHLGASSVWTIFPLFLVSIGASKFWIGIIYLANSGTQFIIMRFVDRFEEVKLMRVGVILSVVVFASYAFASDYRQIIPIQLLLAASWSCLYVGSLLFLVRRNEEKATSVGILNSVISVASVIGPLLGGLISEAFGYTAVMYFAVALSFLGFLISAE